MFVKGYDARYAQLTQADVSDEEAAYKWVQDNECGIGVQAIAHASFLSGAQHGRASERVKTEAALQLDSKRREVRSLNVDKDQEIKRLTLGLERLTNDWHTQIKVKVEALEKLEQERARSAGLVQSLNYVLKTDDRDLDYGIIRGAIAEYERGKE